METMKPETSRTIQAGRQPANAALSPAFAVLEREYSVLYRYLFFDWLFADLGKAANPYEYHAARQYNWKRRKYLCIYLRRWASMAVAAFAIACAHEAMRSPVLATAIWFTGFALTVAVVVVICAAWMFMAASGPR